jgi:DNA invertase Pin-like site-specific DNA recombinase
MIRVGYARVSSVGQSLDVQVDKLTAAGCDPIFEEKASGTRQDRPVLRECLRYLRKGETLVVTRLDRLARSLAHLSALDTQLKAQEVTLQVLDQAIDTTTPHGKMLFGMLAVFAEFENDLRKERQMDGIRKAQARGVYIGGKPALTPEQVLALRAQRAAGALIKDLMRQYGLSKASVYRYLDGTQPQAPADTPTARVHLNGVAAMVE